MKEPVFDKALSIAQLSSWQSSKLVVTNFLGNHKNAECEKEIAIATKEFPPN